MPESRPASRRSVLGSNDSSAARNGYDRYGSLYSRARYDRPRHVSSRDGRSCDDLSRQHVATVRSAQLVAGTRFHLSRQFHGAFHALRSGHARAGGNRHSIWQRDDRGHAGAKHDIAARRPAFGILLGRRHSLRANARRAEQHAIATAQQFRSAWRPLRNSTRRGSRHTQFLDARLGKPRAEHVGQRRACSFVAFRAGHNARSFRTIAVWTCTRRKYTVTRRANEHSAFQPRALWHVAIQHSAGLFSPTRRQHEVSRRPMAAAGRLGRAQRRRNRPGRARHGTEHRPHSHVGRRRRFNNVDIRQHLQQVAGIE
jgi:hypothetical protein